MATAIQQPPRERYVAAATQAWEDWKSKGNEPELAVVKARIDRELGVTPNLGVQYGRSEQNGQLDSALSFLYWDIVENGKGALDYNVHDGFIKHLLTQARTMLASHTSIVKIITATGSTRSFTMGPRVSVKGSGYTSLVAMSKVDRDNIAEEFIAQAKTALYRWHSVKGTDWTYIRRVLVRLCKEMRAEWKKIS